MQAVRNVAIVAVLALGVYVIPGGGTAAETALTALTMGFLAAIGFFVYRLYRENQLTLMTLTDASRAVLYGAFGVVALMVAGTDELLSSGVGTIAWIALIALSAFAVFRVWTEASNY
jgi:hypothetical protein